MIDQDYLVDDISPELLQFESKVCLKCGCLLVPENVNEICETCIAIETNLIDKKHKCKKHASTK